MTTVNAELETATLQMIRAEINTRELHRWMGTRRLQDPGPRYALPADRVLRRPGPQAFPRDRPARWVNLLPVRLRPGWRRRPERSVRHLRRPVAKPHPACRHTRQQTNARHMADGQTSGVRRSHSSRRPPPQEPLRSYRKPNRSTQLQGWQRPARQGVRRVPVGGDAAPEQGGMERKREQVYAEWLSAQLGRIGGASLDVERTKLVSFQRTRAIRKLHARHSEGPDAVMRGILTITDAEAFSICWPAASAAIARTATGCCSFAPPAPRRRLHSTLTAE